MDRIYRKICLEDSRSRTQGMVPFIKYGESAFTFITDDEVDGNWGGFVGNPVDLVEQDKTYMDVMLRYFKIWKQIRNGVILKKIEVNGDCDCAPDGLSWTEKFNENKDPYDLTDCTFNKEHFYFNDKTETYFLTDTDFTGANGCDFIILVDDTEEMVKCGNYLDMSWGDYCKFVDDNYLGKIVVPDEMIKLGDRVPYIMFYADIPEYLKWMTDNRNTNDCCIKKIWEERGGDEFISYLERVKSELDGKYNAANSLIDESNSGCIPTISVSISLTQNSADEGAFVAHDDTWYEDFNGDADEGREMLCYPYDVPGGQYTYDENNILEVPSYLPNMMHTPFFYDDNRKIINGTLKRYGEGEGFFKFTYRTEVRDGITYYWWEINSESLTDAFEVADGQGTTACKNQQKYRILTMVETVDSLVPSKYNIDGVTGGLSNGDYFYFLVMYENSSSVPADIPFDIGVPLNLVSVEGGYIGDMILSTAVTDGNITIEYVIGGNFGTNKNYTGGGIKLEETHPYYPAKEFLHTIDGVSAASVYCNYIDFEADAKVGVSSYNGLSGMFTTSIIKEIPTGEVWTSPSGSIRSVIYKEDYLLGVSYEPNTDIDISYDNGSMTAWEKHFKLGECNTFQDLLDYSNNYFNLQ